MATWVNLMDIVYPVGSVYISYTSTSPATRFGGTWTRIAAGTFLVSSGGATSGDYAVGKTGGAAEVKLSADALPQSCLQSFQRNDEGSSDGWCLVSEHGRAKWESSFVWLDGGNRPHENRPPYLSVDMWRRTA